MVENRSSVFALEPSATKTAADARQQRLAKEAEMLEEARQELRDGKGLSEESLDRWLEEFVNGDLPVGTPRRR